MKEDLEKPTPDLVKRLIKTFKECSDDPRQNNTHVYFAAIKNSDFALNKLFKQFPKNDNLEIAYLKVVAVNALYSTNIYDTYRMAYHIFNLKIDKSLEVKDTDLIKKISVKHGIRRVKNNKDIEFYSFATKYCSFHNPETFPIYDSYIENILIEFNKKYPFHTNLKRIDFRDYKKFLEILQSFKNEFNLTEFNLKQIDQFLWIYSKIRLQTNQN